MAKIPVVSKDVCIGCGTCMVIAPKTFTIGADGKSKVVSPSGDSLEKIQEAIESCPVSAIAWSESE